MKRFLLVVLFFGLIFSLGCVSNKNSFENAIRYNDLAGLIIPLVAQQDSILEGIPLLVISQIQSSPMLQQDFIIKAWTGKKYLGIIGGGRVQEDGTLWIEFTGSCFKAQAGKKFIFWVTPKDRDKIGIKEVLFIVDNMFSWNGDNSKNPIE